MFYSASCIIVTGGAGFIGSNFILDWFRQTNETLINIDVLTYANNLKNLENLKNNKNYHFIQGNICDYKLFTKLLWQYQPRAIIHFAAESHVDRSIINVEEFIQTNIVGTFRLLEAVKAYWDELDGLQKNSFRFLHVSTDEVYGSLEKDASAFCETSPYMPNNPYAASKAASNHLVRSYHQTYGLPVLTTNCSNNYGPYQFPEKLIPLCIYNALAGKQLPIYGDGQQIRDWLYVTDHCSAIRRVLAVGCVGEVYNIGSRHERSNLYVVTTLCQILDKLHPHPDKKSYLEQIAFVADRPGHDRRYGVDTSKIERDLNWKSTETFETGIYKTILWYLQRI